MKFPAVSLLVSFLLLNNGAERVAANPPSPCNSLPPSEYVCDDSRNGKAVPRYSGVRAPVFSAVDTAPLANYTGFTGSLNVSLGFDFVLYNQTYSSVSVHEQGALIFSGGSIDGTGNLNPLVQNLTMVAPFAAGPLQGNASGAVLSVGTVGTAPNRSFVASFQDFRFPPSTEGQTFQVVLSEGTNAVQIFLASVSRPAATAATAVVGLSAAGRKFEWINMDAGESAQNVSVLFTPVPCRAGETPCWDSLADNDWTCRSSCPACAAGEQRCATVGPCSACGDDGVFCTTEVIDDSTCGCLHTAYNSSCQTLGTSSSSLCETRFCDAVNDCQVSVNSCDDSRSCTVDSCGPGGCRHLPNDASCTSGGVCNPQYCDPSGPQGSGCALDQSAVPRSDVCFCVPGSSAPDCLDYTRSVLVVEAFDGAITLSLYYADGTLVPWSALANYDLVGTGTTLDLDLDLIVYGADGAPEAIIEAVCTECLGVFGYGDDLNATAQINLDMWLDYADFKGSGNKTIALRSRSRGTLFAAVDFVLPPQGFSVSNPPDVVYFPRYLAVGVSSPLRAKFVNIVGESTASGLGVNASIQFANSDVVNLGPMTWNATAKQYESTIDSAVMLANRSGDAFFTFSLSDPDWSLSQNRRLCVVSSPDEFNPDSVLPIDVLFPPPQQNAVFLYLRPRYFNGTIANVSNDLGSDAFEVNVQRWDSATPLGTSVSPEYSFTAPGGVFGPVPVSYTPGKAGPFGNGGVVFGGEWTPKNLCPVMPPVPLDLPPTPVPAGQIVETISDVPAARLPDETNAAWLQRPVVFHFQDASGVQVSQEHPVQVEVNRTQPFDIPPPPPPPSESRSTTTPGLQLFLAQYLGIGLYQVNLKAAYALDAFFRFRFLVGGQEVNLPSELVSGISTLERPDVNDVKVKFVSGNEIHIQFAAATDRFRSLPVQSNGCQGVNISSQKSADEPFSCAWASDTLLKINLALDSEVYPGDEVFFEAELFRDGFTGLPYARMVTDSSGYSIVWGAGVPNPIPVARVSGPTKSPQCAPLTLSGGISTGPRGGQDMMWAINPPVPSASQTGFEFNFGPGSLAPGTYNVSLRVKNRWGYFSSPAHHTIEVSAIPAPVLTVGSISAFAWQEWRLSSSLTFPDCFSVESVLTVSYSWEHVASPSLLNGMQLDSATLAFNPAAFLQNYPSSSGPGTRWGGSSFDFQLTATVRRTGATDINVTATGRVDVISSPPFVSIAGGARAIALDEITSNGARLTCAAEDRVAGYNYFPCSDCSIVWRCPDAIASCCTNATDAVLDLSLVSAGCPLGDVLASSPSQNTEFEFECTATSGAGPVASAKTTITLVPEQVPVFEIKASTQQLDGLPAGVSDVRYPTFLYGLGDLYLQLRGNLSGYSYSVESLQWEVVQSTFPLDNATIKSGTDASRNFYFEDYAGAKDIVRSDLVVSGSAIPSGVTRFRCVVRLVGYAGAVPASITVQKLAAPRSGKVLVSQDNNGTLHVSCRDWVSSGGHLLAYSYNLCRFSGSGGMQEECLLLSAKSSKDSLSFAVPWVLSSGITYNFTLQTFIFDLWGSVTEQKTRFSYTPPARSSDFRSIMDGEWSRANELSWAMREILRAANAAANATAGGADMARRQRVTQEEQQEEATSAVRSSTEQNSESVGRSTTSQTQVTQTLTAVARIAFPMRIGAQVDALQTVLNLLNSDGYDASANAQDVVDILDLILESYLKSPSSEQNASVPAGVDVSLNRFQSLLLGGFLACGQTGEDTSAPGILRSAVQTLRRAVLDDRVVGILNPVAVFVNETANNLTTIPPTASCLFAGLWQYRQLDESTGAERDVSVVTAYPDSLTSPAEAFASPGVEIQVRSGAISNAACARRDDSSSPWIQAQWSAANFSCTLVSTGLIIIDRPGQYAIVARSDEPGTTPSATLIASSTTTLSASSTTGSPTENSEGGDEEGAAVWIFVGIAAGALLVLLLGGVLLVLYRKRGGHHSHRRHKHHHVRMAHIPHDGSCSSEFETCDAESSSCPSSLSESEEPPRVRKTDKPVPAPSHYVRVPVVHPGPDDNDGATYGKTPVIASPDSAYSSSDDGATYGKTPVITSPNPAYSSSDDGATYGKTPVITSPEAPADSSSDDGATYGKTPVITSPEAPADYDATYGKTPVIPPTSTPADSLYGKTPVITSGEHTQQSSGGEIGRAPTDYGKMPTLPPLQSTAIVQDQLPALPSNTADPQTGNVDSVYSQMPADLPTGELYARTPAELGKVDSVYSQMPADLPTGDLYARTPAELGESSHGKMPADN